MIRASMALVSAVSLVFAAAPSAAFTAFESGPVRPLALSPDGTRLFATNIPDNRLEIFAVGDEGLTLQHSVAVGLEPVAVAARSDDEVWVVNHLSDSVSVVDVSTGAPFVARTLWVGDEPRDVVFAGSGRTRAFITAAHRGQNLPFDPQLTTPGVGRADVWVFDAGDLGSSAGGTPLTVVTLFGDTPRPLAVSLDGGTVYAGVHRSGNQTTVLNEEIICDGGAGAECFVDDIAMPGGLPGPLQPIDGIVRPEVGLIVKYDRDSGAWQDELGRDWRSVVRFDLPDYDVFAIDANADPPVERQRFAHVGTVLFNMATNPVSGDVYVTNTEARNEVRFEGAATAARSSVRGHLHETRISIIAAGGVTSHHLNSHIDYDVVPSPPGTAERSLAIPLDMAISGDGATLYVAAFGSAAIGIVDTGDLSRGDHRPSLDDLIPLRGGGPCGLVLDESADRLFVLTRFDNTVSIVDLSTRRETQRIALHNPEPATIVEGRPFLYDARIGSSNGEAACASCHVFGDVDHLAWDLGDPDGEVITLGRFTNFHPMKGPMTVQTLRGLANHGAMHWRGERNGAVEPGGDAQDERAAFLQFNPAFDSLLGRGSELSDSQMQTFADFALRLMPPPNPVRRLDNQLNAEEDAGRFLYHDTFVTCSGCHTLNPAAGRFGTNGVQTISLETQEFKTPQLRNLYDRVGMFGGAPMPMFGSSSIDTSHQGEQIRGFGYLHDGSLDTLFRFLSANIFALPAAPRRQIEAFLLAFDANLAPVVGQQVTLAPGSGAAAAARRALFEQRAGAGECDLVAHATQDGEQRGWLYDGRTYESDRSGESTDMTAILRQHAVTFTCVPPGDGFRIAVDRDGDGLRNGDELDDGSDPADASSPHGTCAGDCDGDGRVTVGELIRAVAIALGRTPLRECTPVDSDADDNVAIAELVGAVRNALQSCG